MRRYSSSSFPATVCTGVSQCTALALAFDSRWTCKPSVLTPFSAANIDFLVTLLPRSHSLRSHILAQDHPLWTCVWAARVTASTISNCIEAHSTTMVPTSNLCRKCLRLIGTIMSAREIRKMDIHSTSMSAFNWGGLWVTVHKVPSWSSTVATQSPVRRC